MMKLVLNYESGITPKSTETIFVMVIAGNSKAILVVRLLLVGL